MRGREIPIIIEVIKQYEEFQEMNVFGVKIPASEEIISSRDKNLIDRYASYDY